MMQDWFKDAKFGIIIHWGLYSVEGVHESWAMPFAKMSYEEYFKQLEGFTAEEYDPYQWAELFKEAGIGLCLDDFGSGYANLNTVLKLPFSSIKIDRSLLQGICVETSVADFYKNIVGILQGMGYLLIAEGVETEEEVKLLRGWGIDMVQGFYFSKPVNSEEIYRICCQNVKK